MRPVRSRSEWYHRCYANEGIQNREGDRDRRRLVSAAPAHRDVGPNRGPDGAPSSRASSSRPRCQCAAVPGWGPHRRRSCSSRARITPRERAVRDFDRLRSTHDSGDVVPVSSLHVVVERPTRGLPGESDPVDRRTWQEPDDDGEVAAGKQCRGPADDRTSRSDTYWRLISNLISRSERICSGISLERYVSAGRVTDQINPYGGAKSTD